jgi:outer membrane receptor for ferric coprogen and ferric-rhodotorulic acid
VIDYGDSTESFIDFAEQYRAGGYGTLDMDVGDATTLSFGGILENVDTSSHSGLPTFTDGRLLDVSPSTFIGAPWNKNDMESREGFADVEHEFANGGVLKVSGRFYERDTDIKTALAITGVDPITGDFSMMTFARNFEEETGYLDANYTAPFFLRGNRSEYTVGVDYRDTDQSFVQNFDFGIPTQNIDTFDPKSIEEPDITFPGVGPGFRLNTTTKSEEYSAYGWARLGLTDRLLLSVGGRYISYESKSTDDGRGIVTADLDEDRFVPFLGIGYDLNNNLTAYASYSEIFQPQNGNLATGARIDPLEGTQYEVGLKGSWIQGKLNAQIALFRLEDENRAIEDPDNVGAVIGAPESINKGVEFNVSGQVMPGLDITAGYAYVDSDLDVEPISDHNLNIWGKYTFLDGALRNAYAGLGVRYASSFDTVSGGVNIKAPSYTVFDALLGYKVNEKVDVQLYVKNLFDEEYVERINSVDRGTFYGVPLSADLRVSVAF